MNTQAITLAKDLAEFINNSPVSYFAVDNMMKRLEAEGYVRLNEEDSWNLKAGGKYFVVRNSSALIAFTPGKTLPWEGGFRIAGAHTDSPSLKMKNDSLNKAAGCLKVAVETYGGGISSTWLDRDLSLAGRVVFYNNGVVDSLNVDFKKAVGIIPNLAIHLNREANKGFEYNKQNHLPVVLAGSVPEGDISNWLKELIAKEAGVKAEDILDMDMYFYDVQKASLVGVDESIISGGRIDNLAMCHSVMEALIAGDNEACNVGVFFDNEEIGSQTFQGADSNFLSSLLDRIVFAMGGAQEECFRSRARSFIISADGAHGLHPNFSEKHDKDYAPLMNKGPVIKISANFRYATTAETAGKFITLCEKRDVPYQKLANRSDVPSGSTIGPMSTAGNGIRGIDVGNPVWAMHSLRETAGVLDHWYMTEVLKEFYNTPL